MTSEAERLAPNAAAPAAATAQLARLTREANQPVQELCRAALARQRERSDAQWSEREPRLHELARALGVSRTQLAQMRDELQRSHAQLQRASEHIETLQHTSFAMEQRLRVQVQEEAQLSEWLATAVLPPPLVHLLVEEPIEGHVAEWVRAVGELDRRLADAHTLDPGASAALQQAREVAEQCRAAAIAKILPQLLALIEPIRTSVTTTLSIRQSSMLLPHYEPLYRFLAKHAPRVAAEVQRAYVNSARLYYETTFRRYTRELRRILTRWSEPAFPLAQAWRSDADAGAAPCGYARERLQFARTDDAGHVVLAYMAEDPTYRACPENLFHTLTLVLGDTACSEYAFLARFFAGAAGDAPAKEAAEAASTAPAAAPAERITSLSEEEAQRHEANAHITRESWRQVMEPALFHWAEFGQALLQGQPALLPVLCIVSLVDAIMELVRRRRCLTPDCESALIKFLIEAWPHVGRALDAECQALSTLVVHAHLPGAPASPAGARAPSMLERWGAAVSASSSLPTDISRGSHAAAALHKVRCTAPCAVLTRQLLAHYAELYRSMSLLSSEQHQATLFGGYVDRRASAHSPTASRGCAVNLTGSCTSTTRTSGGSHPVPRRTHPRRSAQQPRAGLPAYVRPASTRSRNAPSGRMPRARLAQRERLCVRGKCAGT